MQAFQQSQPAQAVPMSNTAKYDMSDDDGDILMMQSSFGFPTNTAGMDFDDAPKELPAGISTYMGAKGIVKNPSRTSTASAMSSTSSSASLSGEMEPELSQSFGSTRSYDIVTPSKYAIGETQHAAQHPFRNEARWSSLRPNLSSSSSSTVGPSMGSGPSSAPMVRAQSCTSPTGSPRNNASQRQSRDDSAKNPFEKPFLYNQSLHHDAPRPAGLAGRLKIDPAACRAIKDREGPLTPGGHEAFGARDGAGDGSRPVSPFKPPSPLVTPCDRMVFGSTLATEASTSTSPARPKILHRHTAVPVRPTPLSNTMSPLQETLASVELDTAKSASRSTSPSNTSLSFTSSSSNSTLLTPPFSPATTSKLLPAESPEDVKKARSGSFGSTSSLSTSSNARSSSSCQKRPEVPRSVSPRAKVAKGKVSPYPLPHRDASQVSKATSSAMVSSKFQNQGPQQDYFSGFGAKTVTKDASRPAMLASAPRMEKCYSEPVPRTVSARHLMGRTLHPKFVREYELGDELGSGGFGFVVAATRVSDGRPVAVKFIWRNKVPSHGWVRDDEFGAIPMEAFVLRVIDSPFVVKYIDLLADKDFFYLIQELHGSPWKAPQSEEKSPEAKPPQVNATSKPDKSTVKKALAPIKIDIANATRQSSLQPDAAGARSTPKANTARSPSVAVFPPESNVPVESSSSFSTSPQAMSEASNDDETMSESALSDTSAVSVEKLRPAPMERRASCDLFECIEQHSYFSEDRARWIFAQIVEAVYELDKKGICHRDIKDENCVVDRDFNVKLIDFGSAVVTDPRQPAPYFNRFFGTMTFAPSEILQGKQYRAPHAEVWSLGVLLSILLTGECPFSDPRDAVRGRLSRPTDKFSADALDLLMSCIVVDPDRRANIRHVRHHPWVEKAWVQQRNGKRPDGSRVEFKA